MDEKNEQINYQDHVLPPGGDVLVPVADYIAINNLTQAVEREHSKVYQTDKYAYYHRQTHEKLSNKSKVKMDPEKLASDYYENIDLEATTKTRRVDRDDLGTAALRLMGTYKGIFRYNVDQGNSVPRSTIEGVTASNSTEPESAPSEIGKANES